MKKKILFVIPEYSHGGTNKSLESLLSAIDEKRYEISIFCLYEDGGVFYKNIFKPYIIAKSLLYVLAHDNVITRKVMGVAMKLFKNLSFNWLYRYEANRLQHKYKFDTVIAFQEGSATQFVSLINYPVNRIAWVHCDYANRFTAIEKKSELSLYYLYNHIVSVSYSAVHSFNSIYPELKDRTKCIYNLIDCSYILRQSSQDVNFEKQGNCFNLISVGRFVAVKQFGLIPQIVQKLKLLTKKSFCWYIVGDGNERNMVESVISSMGLDKNIKILGAKDNPYPYFKQSDLYVCTSLSESFSYTIAESKTLHVPVLTNDFPVANEVVSPNEGWICNVKDMAFILKDIIEDKNCIYSNVKKTIDNFKYDNNAIVDTFCKLI